MISVNPILIDELDIMLNDICPESLQEDWDNSGWQLKIDDQEISRILVALEVTSEVISEAEELGAQLIITHHPLLFSGLKTLDTGTVTGNYLYRLMRSDISVYSMHTNFDIMDGGNNDFLGHLLGIRDVELLGDDSGYCRAGLMPEPMTLDDAAHYIADILNLDVESLHIVGDPGQPVEDLAWCTGSGSEFISLAADYGYDLFITGDVKYHDAQYAKETGIGIIDIGHYGSEKIFAENLIGKLIVEAGEGLELFSSQVDADPFCRFRR